MYSERDESFIIDNKYLIPKDNKVVVNEIINIK